MDGRELDDFLSCFSEKIRFSGMRVLDLGCGDGLLAMQIACAGAKRVLGVDMRDNQINQANEALKKFPRLVGDVEFKAVNIINDSIDEKFDIVVSLATFEHVDGMPALLDRIKELLVPGGILISAFGPLFQSPFGDHFSSFFKYNIPYRGVLFNHRALVRLYREFNRSYDTTETISGRDGGMNMLSYEKFVRIFQQSGMSILELEPRVHGYGKGPLTFRKIAIKFLCTIPYLRNYIASSPVVVLRK